MHACSHQLNIWRDLFNECMSHADNNKCYFSNNRNYCGIVCVCVCTPNSVKFKIILAVYVVSPVHNHRSACCLTTIAIIIYIG